MFTKKKLTYCFFIIIMITTFSFSLKAQKSEFTIPEWSKNLGIYEVNLRQYTEEGTFKAFAEHLPAIKEMGVGIIWFMPIHPIGKLNRKGTLGSYYSVKDYKGVNPEFGTLEEFKELVKQIHSMGMYVIIDWVANHTAWDNPLTESNSHWFTKDEKGNFVPPVDDWTDVIDLNYDDNPDLWDYKIECLKFWIEECNIDGYRCDVAGMVPTEFWVKARKELNKLKPVFMLAEWDTPEMHPAFDMTYAWELHKVMNAVAVGEKNVTHIDKQINKDIEIYPTEAYRMQFTSNHDENSWNGTVFERLGNAAEIFAVFTFMIKDMPLVYSGQEAGMEKRLEFFEKDPIEWRDHPFRKLYNDLFHLKKNNKAIWNGIHGGEIQRLITSNDESIYAIAREKDNDKIIALFNFSTEQYNFAIKDDALIGNYVNFFSGEEITFEDKEEFSLDTWEYVVFVKRD